MKPIRNVSLEEALRTGVVPARTARPMPPVAAAAFDVARAAQPRRPPATGDDAARGEEVRTETGEEAHTEALPCIDEHVARIDAPAARVWAALVTTMGKMAPPQLPRPLAAAWGLAQPTRVGEWTTQAAIGDTIPGFAVAECEPGRLLTLRGSHRFSRYELRFELDARDPRTVEVHATTSAAFPGGLGKMYRALVIGTGGHRIAVRRMLASVARRAERRGSSDEGSFSAPSAPPA